MSVKPWVLVVDDDEDTREMIVLLLGLEGYHATGACDGLDALERIHAGGTPPSLVLLDMRMPRMNGTDFACALRRDPELAAVPIVVLSGDGAAHGGPVPFQPVEWVIKPVDLSHLRQIVAGVLRPAEAESPVP
jgi:two-component system, chemotaxis family, chemotaxis protein CheY